jgi:Fe(II)/alpha-ketoglutarate-dependent arginine beta-hydroxylase
MKMHKLTVSAQEAEEMRALVDGLAARFDSVDSPEFMRQATLVSHEVPRRVRQHLIEFKLLEPASALCLLSGLPVDESRIGPTPKHWQGRSRPTVELAEEILLVLLGSLLGDVIGWATQQDGYLVHDVCPIPGHEGEQIGTGSEQLIWWHTEDAFHPLRGDYLGLLCLRNPDGVATTFANLERLCLSDEDLDVLFTPHYTIRPDESHQAKNRSGNKEVDELLERSYRKIEQMKTRPEKIALLHGDRRSPYIRIDPYFMDAVPDPQARAALDNLIAAIERDLREVVLSPGDLCFIDNFKAVHGRRPFKARYDGTDRWLKRLNVTRDLRRSRDARIAADSRVIH